DLEPELDHALLRQRRLGAHDLLERLAVEELHGDVVGALVLAAVEDSDHVRVVQAGRGLGLAPEALHELLVVGEAPVEHLDGDLASQVGVLGAVDVRHPSGADPTEHAVALVDEGVAGDLRHPVPPPSSASRTDFAIGAATVPPCPFAFGIVTATAIRGFSTGAKQMNHAWVNSRFAP